MTPRVAGRRRARRGPLLCTVCLLQPALTVRNGQAVCAEHLQRTGAARLTPARSRVTLTLLGDPPHLGRVMP